MRPEPGGVVVRPFSDFLNGEAGSGVGQLSQPGLVQFEVFGSLDIGYQRKVVSVAVKRCAECCIACFLVVSFHGDFVCEAFDRA